MKLEDELDTAKQVAIDAGAILLEYYAKPADVAWKRQNDPVTTADHAASRFIVEALQARYPDDAVLSEEVADDRTRLERSRVWIVDPMDGTKEFITRTDEFSVMIGLAVEGESRIGVVCQPTSGKLYYAARGDGAFLDAGGSTRRLQVSPESDPGRMTLAVSRSHPSPRVEAIRTRLGIPETIQSGSLGLKVGLISEGRAHVYVNTSRRTYLWDTCGPEAILHEAGGRATDLRGAPFRYDRAELANLDGVIISNGAVHARVVEVVSGLP